jgi:hypothetical protein
VRSDAMYLSLVLKTEAIDTLLGSFEVQSSTEMVEWYQIGLSRIRPIPAESIEGILSRICLGRVFVSLTVTSIFSMSI